MATASVEDGYGATWHVHPWFGLPIPLRREDSMPLLSQQRAFKGGTVMKPLVIGSIVLLLLTLGWDERSVGEEVPAPRGGFP